MVKIITTNNRIIFEGHADTVQECETISLMCEQLKDSKAFMTIKYESGYAEFEKVGATNDLKFTGSVGWITLIVNFDEHISSVTIVSDNNSSAVFSTSGEAHEMVALAGFTGTAEMKFGYVLDTIDEGTITSDNTFSFSSNEITLTSKEATVSYPKINSFTRHGKSVSTINSKPIRYVHYKGNTYEMVYQPILPKLATPQNVSADGTTITFDAVENATSYEILADGVSIGTVEATEAETWILNEDCPLGFWYRTDFFQPFTSNGISVTSVNSDEIEPNFLYLFYGGENVAISDNGTNVTEWISEAYRIVTYETAPTGDLRAWLESYATKQ